ncbi:MAG: YihY/virulence factor BrkB family protein [Lapillicoccus sp.]
MATLTARVDAFQRRHRWASLPIAVTYKFFDDQGSYLAALIAYYGLVSLFPLLLLLTSVLGFVLQGDAALQQRILHSAISDFPVIGTQISAPSGLRGSGVAILVGAVGAVYGSIGGAQAVQHAMNVAWAVPRNRRPNPIKARLRSLVLIATAGLAVLGATLLTALSTSAGASGVSLGVLTTLGATIASILLNAGVFVLAFQVSTARRLSWREMAPGALTAAVLWQVLQGAGTAYVQHVLKNSSETTGAFAFVLALIAWLFLASACLVLSVEINVVLSKGLSPRALLTPFTDEVDLTEGDKRTYAAAAQAQRTKGFETIDVSFDHDGQNAAARADSAANPPADPTTTDETDSGQDAVV